MYKGKKIGKLDQSEVITNKGPVRNQDYQTDQSELGTKKESIEKI